MLHVQDLRVARRKTKLIQRVEVGESVGNNCNARFFLLSSACVSNFMGREGEKAMVSALTQPATYGTDKIEAPSRGET